MAASLTGGHTNRVFVLSIPDYGVTRFGSSRGPHISAEIDLFNAASKTLCDQYGIAYFDFTSISREAATELDLIASDGLHPSGKNVWAMGSIDQRGHQQAAQTLIHIADAATTSVTKTADHPD